MKYFYVGQTFLAIAALGFVAAVIAPNSATALIVIIQLLCLLVGTFNLLIHFRNKQ